MEELDKFLKGKLQEFGSRIVMNFRIDCKLPRQTHFYEQTDSMKKSIVTAVETHVFQLTVWISHTQSLTEWILYIAASVGAQLHLYHE